MSSQRTPTRVSQGALRAAASEGDIALLYADSSPILLGWDENEDEVWEIVANIYEYRTDEWDQTAEGSLVRYRCAFTRSMLLAHRAEGAALLLLDRPLARHAEGFPPERAPDWVYLKDDPIYDALPS